MKVLSIIITYNRKDLVFKCIRSILNQSIDTDILLVDNASTDDTVEFIKNNFRDNNKIKIIQLKNNIGGAGGFYEGVKYALNLSYNWFWLMDDDGYPHEKCLDYLLDYANKNNLDAISPVQLNIKDFKSLAFPLTYECQQLTGSYDQLCGIEFIPNEANLFNGLLITKDIVELIGLPKAELFIRGDEVEYTKRMKKNSLKFGTLVSAMFFHPSDMNERIKVLSGYWTIRDAHSDFKNYYMFRNRAVAFIEDGNAWLLPLDFIRYSYYFLVFKKFDMCGLKLWCQATYDGIKGKLGRHPKY